MCAYCMIGDHQFRYDPPWDEHTKPSPSPFIPHPLAPSQPINPWPVERLKEYLELLRQVKELEDQLNCPCEPNKADYIKMFKERIAELEAVKETAKAKRIAELERELDGLKNGVSSKAVDQPILGSGYCPSCGNGHTEAPSPNCKSSGHLGSGHYDSRIS